MDLVVKCLEGRITEPRELVVDRWGLFGDFKHLVQDINDRLCSLLSAHLGNQTHL
jgi:hypothetical protein